MKLGTRLLIFSSIFLVLLPWFGFHFVEKIEQSLLQGQEEAQSMVANAISTVLRGNTDLFDIDENALYVYPAQQNIAIDGYDEDWLQLKNQFTFFAEKTFSLLLMNNDRYLYGYLSVKDADIVYRNPRYAALDSSDHIRLEYLDEKGIKHRLVLLTEGQGNISVYEVNKNWQTWKTGNHINAVYGNLRETKPGYDVEFRLPITWLQKNRRLSFSVVNVFSENERNMDTIDTTKTLDTTSLNPVLFQSQEINSVIKNLGESESGICVVDKYRRVRSVTGEQGIFTSLCQATDKVSEALVKKALLGEKQLTRFKNQEETLIIAAHPVFDNNEVIGAVLVSKNSRQILSSQRATLRDIVFVTLGLFALVFISLLIFSSWLTYRINRLKKQTSLLIDDNGRFINNIGLSESMHRDEIGDLSRSFSTLLANLNRYTKFLETVPRMLRHEILNPVNTLSMSLQNMQNQQIDLPEITTANSSIKQLQLIVSSLTEAANIDEALTQDTVEKFDIAALLTEYVKNSQGKHTDAVFCYQGVDSGVYIDGNDIRIVQLLDKLKDNALDFSLAGTTILFQIDIAESNKVVISVKNEGEVLTQQQLESLFMGMVSHRAAVNKGCIPHLGIGLYVARQVAQFHHGYLQIANWETSGETSQQYKQGVEVTLVLPLAADK